MSYLAPDFVVHSFLDITPEDVREKSPTSLAVCVDIDGTVTDFHAPAVPLVAQRRLRSFNDAGLLTFIISNCSGRRVNEVHRLFDDLVTGVVTPFDCLGPEDTDDTGRSHRKPAPDMLLAVAARYWVTDPVTGRERTPRPQELLMVGDQIFKDVLAAKQAGAPSVLVQRLGKRDHLGVRIAQRPVEAVIRAALRLPVRDEDWPHRLTPVRPR
jgi:predicted HAD superfamily phosphohydrolase YqeG